MRDTRYSQTIPISVMFVIAIISITLVAVIAVSYSYDTLSMIESGIGFTFLLATVGLLWFYRKQLNQPEDPTTLDSTTIFGAVLGLLWMIEISINNFIAPPLPLRDSIDNAFWAVIALSIFVLAIVRAYRTGSLRHGLRVGAWSGLVSGLLACWTALSLIVFGIDFITRDPLNVAEWAARGADTKAPTMAAYFAFETFAGALLHLGVLGLVMGSVLGVVGGFIGKSVGQVKRRMQRP